MVVTVVKEVIRASKMNRKSLDAHQQKEDKGRLHLIAGGKLVRAESFSGK